MVMKNKYPQLKEQYHLRREKGYYLLYKPIFLAAGTQNTVVPNREASVLGLMDGAETFDTIVSVIRKTNHGEPRKSEALCTQVIQKYKDAVQILDCPNEESRSLPLLEFASSEKLRLNQPRTSYLNRLSAPTRVSIMATAQCSCSCKYCCVPSVNSDDTVLEPHIFIRFLQELQQSGCLCVSFTGGEPTLYPHLAELVKTCTDLGMSTDLATRVQPNTDLLYTLLENGLKWVQVSLDSRDESIVDALSGSGVYKKTMEAISSLVNNNVNMCVNTVLTAKNIDGVNRLVEDLLGMGVRNIRLTFFLPPAWDHDTSDLTVTQEQADRYNKLVLSKAPEWSNSVNAELYYPGLRHRLVPGKQGKVKVACSSGSYEMVIGHDGSAVYCDRVMFLPEMVYGNIQHSSLIALWHGRKLNALRYPLQSMHENTVCGDCSVYNQCLRKGKCYYYSYRNYSRIYAPDYFCDSIPASSQVEGFL